MKSGRLGKFILTLTITTALAGSAFAAETITDALKNGKIGGEAKIWYQTNDNNANKHIFDSENSWFDAGIRLGYNTDTYKGFGIGVNFYAVDDLGAYETWADRSMMNVDHSDVGTWLGEAYISYEIENTSAKLGRQNIKSPLVNSDGWALFPNNFEAITVKNSDIPDTALIGGYVWEERWLKSQDQEFNDFHDGVVMLGVINKSIPDTDLVAWFYHADDDDMSASVSDDNTIATYLEAKTKIDIFNLGAQYIRIDPDKSVGDSTDAIAAMISVKLGILNASAAYSYVGDGALPVAKLSDHRIKTPIYTKTIAGDGDIAGRPDSESFRLSAAVSPLDHLNLTAGYAYYSMDQSKYYTDICDGDCSQAEFICKYTGIKDITLWAALWYSDHEGIGVYNGLNDEALITFRCWARYIF